VNPVLHPRNTPMTVSHARFVGLGKSRSTIVQAALFAGGATTLHQVLCATAAALVIARLFLAPVASHAVLELKARTVRMSHMQPSRLTHPPLCSSTD
jgi:hypothetical protein